MVSFYRVNKLFLSLSKSIFISEFGPVLKFVKWMSVDTIDSSELTLVVNGCLTWH